MPTARSSTTREDRASLLSSGVCPVSHCLFAADLMLSLERKGGGFAPEAGGCAEWRDAHDGCFAALLIPSISAVKVEPYSEYLIDLFFSTLMSACKSRMPTPSWIFGCREDFEWG